MAVVWLLESADSCAKYTPRVSLDTYDTSYLALTSLTIIHNRYQRLDRRAVMSDHSGLRREHQWTLRT